MKIVSLRLLENFHNIAFCETFNFMCYVQKVKQIARFLNFGVI
jgi:hypothetical protein